jgi:hypothetical protein
VFRRADPPGSRADVSAVLRTVYSGVGCTRATERPTDGQSAPIYKRHTKNLELHGQL